MARKSATTSIGAAAINSGFACRLTPRRSVEPGTISLRPSKPWGFQGENTMSEGANFSARCRIRIFAPEPVFGYFLQEQKVTRRQAKPVPSRSFRRIRKRRPGTHLCTFAERPAKQLRPSFRGPSPAPDRDSNHPRGWESTPAHQSRWFYRRRSCGRTRRSAPPARF